MKNKKILLALPTSLILISGIALAQGKANLFERADRNGDGKVTKAEALAVEDARFTELDTNKDGYLTHDEMRAAFAKHRGEKGDPKARGEARFAKQDKNGDGKLTQDEVPRMPKEVFEKIDANKDGALTKTELEQAFQAKMAARKSGQEKGAEQRGPKGPHRGDTDGDGKISRAESKAMAEAFFNRIDQDGNGVITKEEAAAARSAHGKGRHHQKQGKSS